MLIPAFSLASRPSCGICGGCGACGVCPGGIIPSSIALVALEAIWVIND